MRSRFARFGVLVAAVAGLVVTMVPTASANNYQTVTFIGTANLTDCPGLGNIGSPPDFKTPNPTVRTKTGPKGEPQLNVNPGGDHCNFSFTIIICLKSGVGKWTQAPTDCGIFAAGTIWGFCDFYHAKGYLQISSPKGTISEPFTFSGTNAGFTLSGGNMGTNFYGEGDATGPIPKISPGSGSCLTKSARTFTISGDLLIKDCTNGTTAGACNL